MRNLTGRAWESVTEIDRAKLKQETGVGYMLEFLESKRGKPKVDLLGDALSQYFQQSSVFRKDGETWGDYEARHDHLVRDVSKALKDTGSSATIPSEIFGWFLLNQFLKLEPSDIATVKSVANGYKLEDVATAMRKLWGGDSLALKDQERKRGKSLGKIMVNEPYEEPTVWNNTEENDSSPEADEASLEEGQAIFEAACEALAENPEDPECFANFQEVRKLRYSEARKALDKARTSRGFYPSAKRSSDTGRHSRGPPPFNGHCVRCGKFGHKAAFCRQGPASSSKSTANASVGFVGWTTMNPQPVLVVPEVNEVPATVLVNFPSSVSTTDNGVGNLIASAAPDVVHCKAVIDCGASESIVGDLRLQDYYEELMNLGFDPEAEISVDRSINKSFTFGNSQTDRALGLAQLTAGLVGKEQQVEAHVVPGNTPLLLSSRWLYDQEAVINFKTGKALFPKLSSEVIQLERSPNYHLLMPLLAFGGNSELLKGLFVKTDSSDVPLLELSEATHQSTVSGENE